MLDLFAASRDTSLNHKACLVERFRHLSGTVMPELAKGRNADWPVQNDHCFQRIVLDNVCGGVWYEHIARPAYKNLTAEQADRAVQMCEGIIAGTVDLQRLNQKSIEWRADRRATAPTGLGAQNGELLL